MYYINKAIADQRPFYWDFDGTGDNTFDVVPSVVAAATWIATKRQSDPAKTTGLAFDLTAAATVYIMATKQATTPAGSPAPASPTRGSLASGARTI